MTFQARIEELIGAVDDPDGLDQYTTDEAEHLLRTLPEAYLIEKASREKTTSAAGFVVTGKRVFAARRGAYKCMLVEGLDYGRYTNAIHRTQATVRTPVYWIEVNAVDTRLYCYPDPASGGGELEVWYAAYPQIDASLHEVSDLDDVPAAAGELIAVGAARRVLQRRLADAEGENDVEIASAIAAQMASLTDMYDRRYALLSGTRAA